jgi:hypothetical protein
MTQIESGLTTYRYFSTSANLESTKISLYPHFTRQIPSPKALRNVDESSSWVVYIVEGSERNAVGRRQELVE